MSSKCTKRISVAAASERLMVATDGMQLPGKIYALMKSTERRARS